ALKSSYVGKIDSVWGSTRKGIFRTIGDTNINPFRYVEFNADFTGFLGLSCDNLVDCVTSVPLMVFIKKIF
ncbi:MAG: hypothetical protein ABL925_18635, partial [Methylococcales bacterium]